MKTSLKFNVIAFSMLMALCAVPMTGVAKNAAKPEKPDPIVTGLAPSCLVMEGDVWASWSDLTDRYGGSLECNIGYWAEGEPATLFVKADLTGYVCSTGTCTASFPAEGVLDELTEEEYQSIDSVACYFAVKGMNPGKGKGRQDYPLEEVDCVLDQGIDD